MKKILMVFVFVFTMLGVLHAQQVEEAQSVPSGLSDSAYQRLAAEKQRLDNTHAVLTSDIVAFNSDCGNVPSSDSAKIRLCQERHDLLTTRKESYQRDLESFKDDIKKSQVVAPAKDSAPDPIQEKFRETRQQAKVDATCNLGVFLMEHGNREEGLRYLKEARKFYPDGSALANSLDDLIAGRRTIDKPDALMPTFSSRANALLDALQYGNGDWDASYTYLQVAHKAAPDDFAVRDAMNYFEALYAGEKGKEKK